MILMMSSYSYVGIGGTPFDRPSIIYIPLSLTIVALFIERILFKPFFVIINKQWKNYNILATTNNYHHHHRRRRAVYSK